MAAGLETWDNPLVSTCDAGDGPWLFLTRFSASDTGDRSGVKTRASA